MRRDRSEEVRNQILDFGKFNGLRIRDIPDDGYVRFAVEQLTDMRPHYYEGFLAEYRLRRNTDPVPPVADLVDDVVRILVNRQRYNRRRQGEPPEDDPRL